MSRIETGNNCRHRAVRVERAIAELRCGRGIEVFDADGTSRVAAVETLDPLELRYFAASDGRWYLILTPERAEALGFPAHKGAVSVILPGTVPVSGLASVAGIQPLMDGTHLKVLSVGEANPRATAALTIARLGQLLPALVWTDSSSDANHDECLRVAVRDIDWYPTVRGKELQRMSRARVPLAADEQCEFIVYRERFGDVEHLAIVIGMPDAAQPVLVRLHSACLTGDLLGSLRCDCGDQLRGAIKRMGAAGGGVVLYLAQEGRGIGLANKLRAYALQDGGLNTLEADRYLGFRSDERDYQVACAMLADLGIHRVRLLTNNPDKIAALNQCGIKVVGRTPLPGPVNPHNARYLRTKRECAGHLGTEAEGADID